MTGLSRTERIALAGFALLSLLMRAAAFFHYRFDSDEPQHLHVAWGWTAGLVQYRDLFDNHAPLFHIVSAPLLRMVGERPDVLLYMRAPMLLFFAIVIWATYILGRRLYSPRVGAWAAVMLSLFPPFFLKSLEYRTDNFWTALWMLALVVMTSALSANACLTGLNGPGGVIPFTGLTSSTGSAGLTSSLNSADSAGSAGPTNLARLTTLALLAGLILGVAMCVSLKTTLLLITLGGAGAVRYVWAMRRRAIREMAAVLLPFAIGFVVPPTILASWFYTHGAWPNLVYCVLRFNELVMLTRSPLTIWLPRALYLPILALILRRAWKRRAGREDDPVLLWRYFFALALAIFLATLISFWILISYRDMLPVMPLAAIFLAAAIARSARRVAMASAVCALFVPFIVEQTRGFHDGTREHITMMSQVLRLTRPGEPLMDLKGETIYRRRPYYYIFENITRNAMLARLIPDTVEADVVRSQCHVAQADGVFLPDRGRAFLAANFLDMGRLRATGQWVRDDGSFRIAIPGQYVVVNVSGIAHGLVDGQANAPRMLAPGPHRYATLGKNEHVAILWAPAFERGFSPFHLQDRDF